MNLSPAPSLPVTLLLATAIAALAWRAGTLTPRAAVAAAVVASAILAGAGWAGGALLMLFFLSSNLLTRLFPPGAGPLELRSGPRRARQVVANGGAAALGALGGMYHAPLGLWLVACALAAASADTWATEVGQGAGGTPRDLFSWQRVPAGRSGAVSAVGTLAGVLGAGTIGLAAGWLGGSFRLALAALACGVAGMMLDSALGAGWQVRYRCEACGATTEEPHHGCGALAGYDRGIRWLTNDTVNAVATVSATVLGWLAWWLWVS